MSTSTPEAGPDTAKPRRRRRRILWNTAGVAVGLGAVVTLLLLWINSAQFENLVRRRLAVQLQNATGGRVEIGTFHWSPLHLQFEAGGIVIHGDEQPSEAPYAGIESMRVSLSILGLLSPHILLRDLEVTRPQMHLIFYPDGATNQPHPAKPQTASHSVLDTLFNLQAQHMAVERGMIHIDNRAAWFDFQQRYQPLDFTADDVSLLLQYRPTTQAGSESFQVDAGMRDFDLARNGTLRTSVSPVQGFMEAHLDLTRDGVNLRSLKLTGHSRGAPDRVLNITGSLSHFARPQWQARIDGDVDMRLLDPVLGYPNAPEGIARVALTSGGNGMAFHFDGTVKAQKASYIDPSITARDLDLDCRVHGDNDNLRFTSITARLPRGGTIDGDVLLDNWLPINAAPVVMEASNEKTIPPSAPIRKKLGGAQHPAAQPAATTLPHSALLQMPKQVLYINGKVNATLHNVGLDALLDIVSQPPFRRLGMDAMLNGTASATWTHGDDKSLAVSSTLALSPPAQPAAGEVPAGGAIDATYTQRDGAVDLRALELNLPSSRIGAHGHIGAFPLTSPTALYVDLHTANLREFDTVLRDLGLERNGKSGAAALPVSLAGQADFHGSWANSLQSPRLAGTLRATQIDVELPPADGRPTPRNVHWDSIEADGSYNSQQIVVLKGQAQHGAARIAFDGSLNMPPPAIAATTLPHHPATEPAFDSNSLLHLHVRASAVPVADLLPIADVDAQITGSIDAQVTADGPLHDLGGTGWVQLNDGVVYGQPVSMLRAQGSENSQALRLTSVTAVTPAGRVAASGEYDFTSHRMQAEASSAGLDLTKIDHLRSTTEALAGKLAFRVSASGTREEPVIEGRASVSDFRFQGQSLNSVEVTAHTANRALIYDMTTGIDNAALAVHGQTELRGDYLTQAQVDFSRFDVATVFRLAHIEGITSQSELGGAAALSGPLAHPKELRGDLRLDRALVVIAGVHLTSDGALHASLAGSRVSLDPVHITGEDTDVRAQGSLTLFENQRLDFAASGSVNLKLAQTLDHDLTAGGSSTFQVEAHGPLDNPGLRGRVEFQNGSLALEDLPNGLSQIQGVLEFNQNRLEVRSLTAMTGGGQLSLGGYLAYQHGLFASLTVTGRSVRIRYPQGVSSLADADLQLTGVPTNLLLSGNILLTRFSVSPDLDIAALATQASSVQSVAPPDAPSNHVRLDVRIRSSPQLNFQNAYAKLAGEVDLRLRGTLASPSLQGRIAITEGTATIAGTRYELQRGDVTFSNPVRIEPIIDLTATARVEDYDITLGLHGTPDKWIVSYRSDPPLPEADVVALLALGRTQSEQGLYTQQQQQSAGLNPSTDVLLGGALNATVSSRVQKLFGAGSVKVDPSYLGALGNSTTRITVEEQLGKNVTLTYATNVDTTAQQFLQAEIAVNRHVSVLVARDESGVISMVVRATRRYR